MNVEDRTAYYAAETGLSKAAVRRYRLKRVNDWTTTADRKIGGTIRAAERMAEDPDLSWSKWMRLTRQLLRVIREWVEELLDSVAAFAERLASAAEKVLAALERILQHAAPWAEVLTVLLIAATSE